MFETLSIELIANLTLCHRREQAFTEEEIIELTPMPTVITKRPMLISTTKVE